MARQRVSRTQNGGSRAIVRVAKSAGQPGITKLTRPWGRKTVFHKMVPLGTVRTLIKKNPNDGMSLNDARTITTAHGVITPGAGGYKGATRIVKAPNLTPRLSKGTKRVATPRPAPGGVRNPYGRKY